MIGNKPSIYNAQSVYNQGAKKNGVGWGVVSIGGEDYEFVQLLDKLITVRNLDYLPDGITIGDGTTTEPKACYFNNNAAQAKEREQGLLYNWAAVKYLIDEPHLFPDGWKILDVGVCDLISHSFDVSQNTGEGKETCRKHVSWASNNWNNKGNNKSHLSFIPAGRRSYGNWEAYGDYCRLWTTYTKRTYSIAVSPYSEWPGYDNADDSWFAYIRLYKQMEEP